VDAYVLVHQAEDDLIDRLNRVESVRFAARTVGAHTAVFVVGAPSITEVVDQVERVRRWGVLAHETAIPLRPNPPSIKGTLPEPHEAFVGLTVSPPHERIQRVVEALRRIDLTLAVHVVAGNYQVMAELASKDYHELRDVLLLDVPSIEGITSITTSLAVFYNAPAPMRRSPGEMDWFWREPGRPEPHWGTTRQVGA
jgi:DNA-binding Lrp family transcriptional regulator